MVATGDGAAGADAAPRHWYATTLVGLPAGLIDSVDFNTHPLPLSIHGTRESAPALFHALEATTSPEEAGARFRRAMGQIFGLLGQAGDQDGASAERASRRSSYLKLLEGWGFDSNGPQAAVLRGWVESRFGLVPTFHRAPLARFPSRAWVAYLQEKATSRFHNNCINLQLDLLFEFCQWSARRFGVPGRAASSRDGRLRVWRGVDSRIGHRLVEGSLRDRHCVVHLNNLVSFSLTPEGAEMFGDWVLATEVPIEKLVFFPGLLGGSMLAGEDEVIALGGQYRAGVSYLNAAG